MPLEHLPHFVDLDLPSYRFQYDGFIDTETGDEMELMKIFRFRDQKTKGFIAMHLTKEELVEFYNWIGGIVSRREQ